jgi:pimeloyl-ACP methyl ester carboxylesterase
MRRSTRVLLAALALLLLAGLAFIVWGETPSKPMAEALAALQSDPVVKVEETEWLSFTPETSDASTGLIFYPGAHVDYRAYSPAAHQLAAQGYLVVIVHFPLNMAVFSPNAAASVIKAFPKIMHWAVGGHSLGGVFAASFASENIGKVQGLVLWGSYPTEDLSRSTLKPIVIYGSADGLSTPQKVEAAHPLLPAETIWVKIEGGNHAQFGWYGSQPGDNPALVSRADQQGQVVQATIELLESLK